MVLSIFPGMQTLSLILGDFGLTQNALFKAKHIYFQIFSHDTFSLRYCLGTAVFLLACVAIGSCIRSRHTDTAPKRHTLLSFFRSPRVTGPEGGHSSSSLVPSGGRQDPASLWSLSLQSQRVYQIYRLAVLTRQKAGDERR